MRRGDGSWTNQTRKDRAEELLRRLEKGPTLPFYMEAEAKKQAYESLRLWIQSWIVEEVKDLIPELRPKKARA